MMAQIAAATGSVAVGSTIGHGLSIIRHALRFSSRNPGTPSTSRYQSTCDQCFNFYFYLIPSFQNKENHVMIRFNIYFIPTIIRAIIKSPSPLNQILNRSLRKNFELQKHISKTPRILNCTQTNYISAALQAQRSEKRNPL